MEDSGARCVFSVVATDIRVETKLNMPNRETQAPWTISAIAAALGSAVAWFAGAILLGELGRWPDIRGSGGATAVLVGSVVLWRFHPKTWGLILMFFAPATYLLLMLGGFAVAIALGRFEP